MSQTKAELVNGLSINAAADDAITVDSSGRVGIGTTSPDTILEVANGGTEPRLVRIHNSSTNGSAIQFTNTDTGNSTNQGYYLGLGASGDANVWHQSNFNLLFATNNTERMRIDTSGNVGIGTPSPTLLNGDGGRLLHLAGSNNPEIVLERTTSGTEAKASIRITDSEDLRFAVKDGSSSVIEALSIASSTGRITMSTNTIRNNSVLTVKGAGVCPISTEANATSGFSQIIFVNPNGNVGQINTVNSETRYFTTSDYRLKENIIDLTGALTRLKTLQPKRFNWISDETNTIQDGFLAHEVTAVPEAITGTKDEVDSDNNPLYQMIDNSKLVPLLTAALQEEIAKRETLESRVATLEAA